MKKIVLILCVIVFSVGSGYGKKDPAPKTWSGYLMDKMCSKRMVGKHEKMAKHSKTCLTEETCAATGYGIMIEKKFIPFDEQGNILAAKYLATAKKESDFQIEVTGKLSKNKIIVKELKEKDLLSVAKP